MNIQLAKGHRFVTIPLFILLIFSLLWVQLKVITNTIGWIDYVLLILSFLIFIFVLQFFRDPNRKPESNNELDIISPADGILFEIDTTSEKDISIFRIRMRFWDVHVNYMPIKGTLIDQVKKKGIYLPILPGLNKYSKNKNARQTMAFSSENGFYFKVIQISGIFAFRTVSYLKKGDITEKGEKIGMIRFGSETDFHIPSNKVGEIFVKIGQKVKAGQTIIARLK